MFCGWQSEAIQNVLRSASASLTRRHKVIASAQAVASSKSEALEMSNPVRSHTMVWKFSNPSKRPCEISAW